MLLYYITDRTQFPGSEPHRCTALLERISEAARAGVDFIQLREKDLCIRELESLAHEAVEAISASSRSTSLLINSHVDVALAVGAAGVHLRSTDISPSEVRSIWKSAGMESNPIVAISCHTDDDVTRAAKSGADFAVFGPIFEKRDASPTGKDALCSISRYKVPVIALGGVSLSNAALCLNAGAAGIAGIRLFQQGNVAGTVSRLRALAH